MKLFYTLAILWLISLYLGDSVSETHTRFRDATFIIIMIIVLAVFAIDRKIERAVKEIKNPGFNTSAENLNEWIELLNLFFAVVIIFSLGTAAQGALRCVSSGNDFSASCVWDGVWNQLEEDFNE